MWSLDLNHKEVGKECTFMTYEEGSSKVIMKVKVNSVRQAKKFSDSNCLYEDNDDAIKCESRLYLYFFGSDQFIDSVKKIVDYANFEKIKDIRRRYTAEDPYDDENIYPPDHLCVVPFELYGIWRDGDEDKDHCIGMDLKKHKNVKALFERLKLLNTDLLSENFIKGYDELEQRVNR